MLAVLMSRLQEEARFEADERRAERTGRVKAEVWWW